MKFTGFLIVIVIVVSLACSIVKSKQSKELKVVGFNKQITRVLQENEIKTEEVYFSEILDMIK